MIFRPIGESELDRVLPLVRADAASTLTADVYRARLAEGQYRPGWTWIAEEPGGGGPLAVAVWWGDPTHALPGVLDAVLVDDSVGTGEERTALAAGLLAAGHAFHVEAGGDAPPEYHVFLPPDWHDRADVVAALSWRREAARRAGLPNCVERLRFEWTPSDGLPQASRRLRFDAEPDDEVFTDLFRRVLAGSLDAASSGEADRLGPAEQARRDVAFYRDTMLGERSWWRVARTPSGETIGFGVPSRNHSFPVVGYLGVLPEHRGHGYATDILATITRILATETTPTRIRADTDLPNTPMSATFTRLSYHNHARRLVFCSR